MNTIVCSVKDAKIETRVGREKLARIDRLILMFDQVKATDF